MLLPLIWSLTTLLPAKIDLYRIGLRQGSEAVLRQWLNQTQYTMQSTGAFWEQDFTQVDLIVLPTGDRDAPEVIHSGIMMAYPHLKVVSVAHTRWLDRKSVV